MEFGKIRSRKVKGHSYYYVEVDWEGERHQLTQIPIEGHQVSCTDQKHKAEFLLSVIRGRLKDGEFNPNEFKKHSEMHLEQYALEWLELKRPNIGVNTYHDYKSSINNHILKFFGNVPLRSITKLKLRKFQNSIKRSPKGKYNVMGCLRTMLKDACPDYIKRVPEFPGFTGNDKIIDPETEYLEPEAQQKIIEKIAPEDRQVFLFQMVTGCRASESAAFRKQDIKKDHIVFEVTFDRDNNLVPVKGKKPMPFPLTDALREVLSMTPQNNTPFVFINPRTQRPYTLKTILNIWAKACEDAQVERVRLHVAMRHSFASQLVNAENPVPLNIIQALLRHSDPRMTKRYAHTKVAALAPVVDNVIKLPLRKDGVGATLVQPKNMPCKILNLMDYCPFRGMGEKPSPSGEDFSRLAVWSITVSRATQYTISSITWYGSRNTASRYCGAR